MRSGEFWRGGLYNDEWEGKGSFNTRGGERGRGCCEKKDGRGRID